MEISWLGHSCFLIKGKQATVITDPFDNIPGYSLGQPMVDIVTLSHQHPHHNFVVGVYGEPRVIKGPGEYEITNVFITGIRTFHDAEGGRRRGKNTVYLIEIDDMRICHLGDLGHLLSSDQIEEMSDVDILLVPVGGVSTINAAMAAEIISLLEPKIAMPMHFKTEAVNLELEPLKQFLKEMGLKEVVPQPKLIVSKSSLPKETRLIVLDYNR